MDSKLYLCRDVELDPNYNYTLNFTTESEQLQYFATKTQSIVDVDGYSYIREEEAIKVFANIDDLFGVNYIIFNNKNKEYYAFITRKEYISSDTTKLYFEIDVLQTFMWNYTIDESFVEREHQDRMTKSSKEYFHVRYNLEKENLDYGEEYVVDKFDPEAPEIVYCYAFMNKHHDGSAPTQFGENGVPSSYEIIMTAGVYEKKQGQPNVNIYINNKKVIPIYSFIQFLRTQGVQDYVSQIIISRIPPVRMSIDKSTPNTIKLDAMESTNLIYEPVNLPDYPAEYGNDYIMLIARYQTEAWSYYPTISIPLNRMKYTVETAGFSKDNAPDIKYETKLNLYPYHFIKMLYGGNELIYYVPYQTTSINMFQSFSSEASSFASPNNYLTAQQPDERFDPQHALINQVPNYIDLTNDAWKKHILENKNSRMSGFVNDGINAAIGGVGAVSGALTGHPLIALGSLAGLGASSFMKISAQLAKEKDIKNAPIDIKQFNGDLSLQNNISNLLPQFIEYSLPNPIKHKLFKYFMHYGYACNTFKKPNINSRYYYNYIKCIDANIKTGIDAGYRDKIKEIYENGITIWHYREGNYHGVNNYDFENVEINLMEVQNV